MNNLEQGLGMLVSKQIWVLGEWVQLQKHQGKRYLCQRSRAKFKPLELMQLKCYAIAFVALVINFCINSEK